MNPTEPHFLEAISDRSALPRFHSGRTKVPAPFIKCHRVVTMFDVIGQCEVPSNIQVISWKAKTSDHVPETEKADFGP